VTVSADEIAFLDLSLQGVTRAAAHLRPDVERLLFRVSVMKVHRRRMKDTAAIDTGLVLLLLVQPLAALSAPLLLVLLVGFV
jgi:hypothetical protein